jgi:hypothetical protein
MSKVLDEVLAGNEAVWQHLVTKALFRCRLPACVYRELHSH